jgi:hypothetical protein
MKGANSEWRVANGFLYSLFATPYSLNDYGFIAPCTLVYTA